jgi:hypothetical protein
MGGTVDSQDLSNKRIANQKSPKQVATKPKIEKPNLDYADEMHTLRSMLRRNRNATD